MTYYVEYDSQGNIVASGSADAVPTPATGNSVLQVAQFVNGAAYYVDITQTPPVVTALSVPRNFPPGTPFPPTPVVPTVPAPTVTQLENFANQKLSSYWIGSIAVSIGTDAAPIIAYVDVSGTGKANILGLFKDFDLGSTGETWYQSSGNLSITESQLIVMAQALKVYTESAYAAWALAVAGITATPPTITTYAQIVSMAWPVQSS